MNCGIGDYEVIKKSTCGNGTGEYNKIADIFFGDRPTTAVLRTPRIRTPCVSTPHSQSRIVGS